MPYGLTQGQADLVRVFAELRDRLGCAPNMPELAAEMGLTIGGISGLLDGLEQRGWIFRLPGRARGVTLLHELPPLPEPALEITDAGHAFLGARAPADAK